MKKTILVAAIVSLLSISASHAQDAPPSQKKDNMEHKDKGRRGEMYESLNLSQDQKDKLKTFNEGQRTQMQAIRSDATLNDDQKKAKMMELRKARKEKMNEILTPEQKAKWEEQMKERGKADGDHKKSD